jgi:hypothetical protein
LAQAVADAEASPKLAACAPEQLQTVPIVIEDVVAASAGAPPLHP